MKYTPLHTFREGAARGQLFRFPNGYGASISDVLGTTEMVVVRFFDLDPDKAHHWTDSPDTYLQIDYSTDVFGGVTETRVSGFDAPDTEAYLDKIAALPGKE